MAILIFIYIVRLRRVKVKDRYHLLPVFGEIADTKLVGIFLLYKINVVVKTSEIGFGFALALFTYFKPHIIDLGRCHRCGLVICNFLGYEFVNRL